jgi:phosphoadenosine phosphosulfate reductase
MPPLEGPSLPTDATGLPSPSRGGAGDGGKPALEGTAHPPVIGAPDPDGPVWQAGAFHRDAWTSVDGEAALPHGPAIVPKARWLAQRDALAARNAPLGLLIAPAESLDDIAADLPRFALVALAFPKFTDGRAYSLARLLREKHGFAGELRAVGNVLSDQLQSMRRVGFDSFAVTHAPTRRALAEGRIPEVTLFYQPTGTDTPPDATRPWLRRRA